MGGQHWGVGVAALNSMVAMSGDDRKSWAGFFGRAVLLLVVGAISVAWWWLLGWGIWRVFWG
jgi:hypothetical protein